MQEEIVSLEEDLSHSPLYSDDLAPVPESKRTWGVWDLAAIWVGMAVCIPTYLLASYMIKVGLLWYEALIIIGVANLVVTIPMIFNGHAGVKYGVPFPVLGRGAFGINGVHLPAIVRAIVACGWFGIQTWIGGLAIYAIWCAATGTEMSASLGFGKFICFLIFWFVNVWVIWKGTETIRWLEDFSAPILILIGIFLIGWGATKAGGFGVVLEQSRQLGKTTAVLSVSGQDEVILQLNPITNAEGTVKATETRVKAELAGGTPASIAWIPYPAGGSINLTGQLGLTVENMVNMKVSVQFRADPQDEPQTWVQAVPATQGNTPKWRLYLFWLTAMVGFWATMSISIADITRYSKSQRDQIKGQFIGLPGTMILYSFVGIFVTCAALINFGDILTGEDAPWDPVSLIARFDNPAVVILAQLFMLIATLSTNIAANVIAPANAFANAFPKSISFRAGGVITGLIGIAICPWWLLNEISNLLIFVSGLLGPVLGILIADYFYVRRTKFNLAELFDPNGPFSYRWGINPTAMIALTVGVMVALAGYFIPAMAIVYELSWFTGFTVSFLLYALLSKPVPVAASPRNH